eukprot:scaffold1175_cov330-Prasinococcus_capsulatus_cf.AAC.2
MPQASVAASPAQAASRTQREEDELAARLRTEVPEEGGVGEQRAVVVSTYGVRSYDRVRVLRHPCSRRNDQARVVVSALLGELPSTAGAELQRHSCVTSQWGGHLPMPAMDCTETSACIDSASSAGEAPSQFSNCQPMSARLIMEVFGVPSTQ